MTGAVAKRKSRITVLKRRIKKTVEKNIFLLRVVFSLTIFEMLTGKAKVANVINKLYVGVTIVYKLMPSSPMVLVYKTRITKPRILVIKPPISKIKIDVLKVSFFNIHLSYSAIIRYNIVYEEDFFLEEKKEDNGYYGDVFQFGRIVSAYKTSFTGEKAGNA